MNNKGESSAINGLMVDILGIPKKHIEDPYAYTGYFSLVNRWLKKYTSKYIHFTLSNILKYKLKTNKKINVGYLSVALERGTGKFKGMEDSYVIITRDILERNGAKNIPLYMLSAKERRDLYRKSENSVTEEQKAELREKLGI